MDIEHESDGERLVDGAPLYAVQVDGTRHRVGDATVTVARQTGEGVKPRDVQR